jgi:hypothetical protein
MPNLEILPNLMRRRSSGGGAPPSLAAQVEAILAGTNGIALDPTDLATLWQDSAKTVPVTTLADPVGAFRTKWGLAQYDFLQPTAGARPAWNTGSILTDGADDGLAAANLPVFQNAPAYWFCAKINHVTATAFGTSLYFSRNLAANFRFQLQGYTLGTPLYDLLGKRLDADGTGLARSAGGTLTYNTDAVLVGLADFTSGVLSLEKDGSVIATGTVTTGGNSSNTASTTSRLGQDNAATFGNCKIGRMVALPFIPSAGQIVSIKDWVNEVAL